MSFHHCEHVTETLCGCSPLIGGRWWTFAGARANWLLANAARQRGSSIRIDDFYIEIKGPIAIAAIRERMQTLDLDGLSKALMFSKAIDLKFRDAVPENLLASIVNSRAIDRESAERISTQPISPSVPMNDSPVETAGSSSSGQASN